MTGTHAGTVSLSSTTGFKATTPRLPPFGGVLFARVGAGWAVGEISNQSTGYCPEPDSWPAVTAALDRIGLAHPGDFTSAFAFRRCPACGQLNIVREGDFTCAVCDGTRPARWNIAEPGAEWLG